MAMAMLVFLYYGEFMRNEIDIILSKLPALIGNQYLNQLYQQFKFYSQNFKKTYSKITNNF